MNIHEQIAQLIKATTEQNVPAGHITTPEAWARAYDEAKELAATNKSLASASHASIFTGLAELSTALGWKEADCKPGGAADSVINLRIPADADKATRSRLRCAADPKVRSHVEEAWDASAAVAEELGEQRLSVFFSVNSRIRQDECPAPVAAELIKRERIAKRKNSESARGIAENFVKARVRETKKDAKKNGVVIADLMPAAEWQAYCNAVAALAKAYAAAKPVEATTVESDSTPAQAEAPTPTPAGGDLDLDALLGGLGDSSAMKQAVIAALLKNA